LLKLSAITAKAGQEVNFFRAIRQVANLDTGIHRYGVKSLPEMKWVQFFPSPI